MVYEPLRPFPLLCGTPDHACKVLTRKWKTNSSMPGLWLSRLPATLRT
jgi:hypothetical protein